MANAPTGQHSGPLAGLRVLDVVVRRVRNLGLAGRRDFEISNCALNWIVHDEAGWRVDSWGDVAHLDAALDELPA